MRAAPDIFVQIPAYRDSELAPTLRDLYAKARAPQRLRTVVLWQKGRGERLPADVLALPHLDIITVPAASSRGCNWARQLLQQRWEGEPYTLLLDSHHRFVAGWDDLVQGMYDGLVQAGHAKPLLTAYLPAYAPDNDPAGRLANPYTIYPKEREDGLLTRLTSHPMPFWPALFEPQPAAFLSLHFVFTAGSFNREITFDPDIYFFGDEVATGLRAHTWGYDLFHPHRIIGWHAYDRGKRRPHWDDHPDWHRQHLASLDKLRALFAGQDVSGRLLGAARSAQSYRDLILVPLAEA